MIDQEKISDKKHTPQKLYNKLRKLEEYIPEIQLILEKIMIKAELSDDIKKIHEDLYISYQKIKYILDYSHKFMRARK